MFITFLILWIIFNANFTIEILLIGIVVSAALFAFCCKFMDYSLEKEKMAYRNIFRIFGYFVHLLIEIVKSNLAVMRLIMTQKEEPEPMLVTFDAGLTNPAAQALMANTITITPGTITVMLKEGTYTVHCLDSDFAQGIEQSEFIDRLKTMEKH